MAAAAVAKTWWLALDWMVAEPVCILW
jgi:hypothetical protein